VRRSGTCGSSSWRGSGRCWQRVCATPKPDARAGEQNGVLSGKGQADGDGPERQLTAIGRFAKANGFTRVDEPFTDLGVSGTRELADRPGLAALLDRLESNGVRTVIVERADRLATNGGG